MRLIFINLLILVICCSIVSGQTNRNLDRDKATALQTGKRIALVIGNGKYLHAGSLPNPVNDATDMAAALKSLGFEVISGTNQSKQQIEGLIRQFGTRLADTKAVGLFFYAGHGISAGGANYIVPVDADIQAEDEVEYSSVNINFVLSKMAAANNGFNMVILDACRNNPFARKWRNYRDIGDKGGLARIDAPTGTLIAYATKPGDVAADGQGRNGLYTGALLKQMRLKNLEMGKMFQYVRADVISQSSGKQVPFDESSVVGDFYFAGFDASFKAPNYPSLPAMNAAPIEKLPSADEVLGEYARAVGNSKYKTIATLVQKGKVELEYNGQMMSGSIESYSKTPGKSLTIVRFSNGSFSKDVWNGNLGWIGGSSTGTKEATPQQADSHLRNDAIAIGDIDQIRRLYPKISVKGLDTADESKVLVLELETISGQIERMHFDTSSKLLVRWDFLSSSVATQKGINFSSQLFFSDYAAVDGFQIPMTVIQKGGGTVAKTKLNLVELRYNVPLDDKLFKKP